MNLCAHKFAGQGKIPETLITFTIRMEEFYLAILQQNLSHPALGKRVCPALQTRGKGRVAAYNVYPLYD